MNKELRSDALVFVGVSLVSDILSCAVLLAAGASTEAILMWGIGWFVAMIYGYSAGHSDCERYYKRIIGSLMDAEAQHSGNFDWRNYENSYDWLPDDPRGRS